MFKSSDNFIIKRWANVLSFKLKLVARKQYFKNYKYVPLQYTHTSTIRD
jgi:hypothetical protein